MKKPDCCSIDRSRRDFLLKSASGLGALSLLDLFGARAGATARRDDERRHRSALRPDAGARQARDLPAHARRDLARRHVRLQADARAHARPGPAAVGARDAAAVDDVGRPVGISDRRSFARRSSSAARAAPGSATSCPTPARSPTSSASSRACTPSTSITTRRRSSCTRAFSSRAGRRPAPGSATRSAPTTATCRTSSS